MARKTKETHVSNSNTQKLPQHIDNARTALLRCMASVERARATRGQPGGLANLTAAEVESGVFVAQHGRAILDYILLKEGLTVTPQGVSHVG